MKKLAMKMLSLLLVLSLLLPTCVFAQPGQDGDGEPVTQSTTSEETTTFTEGGNSDEDADAPTGGGNGDEDADTPTGGGNSDEDADAPTGGGNSDEDAGAPTGGGNGDGDADVSAEEAAPTVVEMEEVVLDLSDMDLPDNDELFAAYVEREFDRAAGGTQYPVFYSSSHATYGLTPDEKLVYNELKSEIEKIAGGTRTDTIITTTNPFCYTWTAGELGVSGPLWSGTTLAAGVGEAATAKAREQVSKMWSRLLADCPYELYWCDKRSVPFTLAYSDDGGNLKVKINPIKLTVAKEYAVGSAADTFVTNGKPSLVTTAVNNAQSILNTYNASGTTYTTKQKMEGYKNEICGLVSYNDAAAAPGYADYGNPWQMIWVFDGDNSTKVVCEGYAKAFQYLCEKSTPQIKCYNVTGTMGGNHMWNVVEVGNARYLVDVTNCDDKMIGHPDKLFLKAVNSTDGGKTHVVNGSTYTYDSRMDGLFCAGYPALRELKSIAITSPPTKTTYAQGENFDKTGMVVTATYSDGSSIPVTGYTVEGGKPFASGDTSVTIKYAELDTVETATQTVTVTAKKSLNNATITITEPTYTGSAQSVGIKVEYEGTTLAEGTDYTVTGTQSLTDVSATAVPIAITGNGDYEGTVNKSWNLKKASSTCTAPTGKTGLEYNGTAQELVSTGGSATGGTLEYSLDGSSWSTAKPTFKETNAGTYTLHYRVNGGGNYEDIAAQQLKVEIKPLEVTLTWNNIADRTYDGNNSNVTATVSNKAIATDEVNVTVTGGTEANAGSHTATAAALTGAAAGNYKLPDTKPTQAYKINAATITVDTDAFKNYTGVYDGNPHSIKVDRNKIETKGGQTFTIGYNTDGGSTYGAALPEITNVSDSPKTVYYKITAPNHKDKTGTATITINKVDYTPPAVSGTVRSNQVTTNKTLELPALPAGASYTASGTVGGTAGLISSHSVSGTTLTYSTTNQMDGISATITIPVTGATNYNNYYVVVTVIAKDKDDAGVSITNGSSASVTYGETITISATKTASEDGTWTWHYDTTVFDVVGANSESTITLKAMKATTAAVPVKATFESTNYMGNASIAVNVNKATPVAENFMFTAPTVLVYDGSNKMATVTAKGGIAGMGTVTVKYFKDGSLTTETKAVGTYVVKVDVAAGTNYAAISDLTADEWTFTVTRANASVTAAPAAAGSLGYDGSAKNLITAGTCTGGTMKYRLGDSGAWGDAIPQATNAGTYTVWYKVVGDGNHNDTAAESVTVTIARQNITPSVTVSGSYTYNNGNPIIPTVEVKNGGATLTAGTDYDVLVSDNTNAGTGKVTVKERADSNYTFTEVHKTFSIGMANQATLTVTGGTSVVYGETLTLGTSGGSGTGAVTYTVTDVTGKATITGNVLTPTQAGTVKVKATKAADTNYNAIDSAEVEITITKATPTGAPKFTKITSSGKTLGDAALVKTVSGPGDGFSVAGTVEWVDGSGTALADSTSVEANKSYGWKFTPTDSTNYKSISGSVVVYTVRRVSHSGGAAADSAAAAAAQPTVYSGSRGESVKTLQEKLNAKGYNAGSVDGIFGKNTRAAVMAFQKANGLAADGIVGKLTWAKLYDTTAALPAASTATGTQPMVYRGSRGDAVRKLQELLNKKGFDCGAVDGIFGSKTYAAVMAFQKANGLGADGIVGPLTWGKLG